MAGTRTDDLQFTKNARPGPVHDKGVMHRRSAASWA